MDTLQIFLLVIVSLSGIPVGFLIRHFTKEEMKKGQRWFIYLAILSLLAMILSFVFAEGDNLALLLTTSAFILFLSLVPLLKK